MTPTLLIIVTALSQAPEAEDAGVLPPQPPIEASTNPPPGVENTPETLQLRVPDRRPAAENVPSAAGANPPTADLSEWWKKLHPFGYVKAGVFYTFPFTDEQLVGGNGGFRIASARIGMELNLVEKLQVVASVELGAPSLRPDDPLQGGRIVEMRDAYLEYRVCRGFQVRVGQFKAPFNGETLLGDADLPFVTRSVMTDGVNPPEAYGPREGLTLGRQVGLQIMSDRLGGEAIGFRYFVAAVNGNGQNQLFNDSNPVAPVARLELELFKKVNLGVNGFYNVKTEGVRPNRLNVNQLGYGVDATLRLGDFRMLAGFLGRQNSYSAAILPSDSSLGFMAQAHYVLTQLGLEAAVRFSWFEPSNAQFADRVWDLNAMVGYRFKAVPLRVIAQYTHRWEEQSVAIGNDSLDAMLQATW